MVRIACEVDADVTVTLNPDECALVARGLLMLRAKVPQDGSFREKRDGSFFTDHEITLLRERFP